MKIAILSVARQGVEIALRLRSRFDADVYASEKYRELDDGTIRFFDGNLAALVGGILTQYEGFVFVMATGIVMRVMAPHIVDKRSDPAIVVVDVRGQFAISLCSGHLGGANELATEVAGALGAIPVVTTGTDVNQTFSPDLYAKRHGHAIDDWVAMKRVSAALVDGLPVGVYARDAIPPSLERYRGKGVELVDDPDRLLSGGYAAGVVVSPWIERELEGIAIPIAFIRPRVLVAGIGCNRGTSAEEIEAVVNRIFAEEGLAASSLRAVASTALKKDEPGLIAFARSRAVSFVTFSPGQLDAVSVPTPSERVRAFVGSFGVCEPAALLASPGGTLAVTKRPSGNCTVAIAIDAMLQQVGVS